MTIGIGAWTTVAFAVGAILLVLLLCWDARSGVPIAMLAAGAGSVLLGVWILGVAAGEASAMIGIGWLGLLFVAAGGVLAGFGFERLQ